MPGTPIRMLAAGAAVLLLLVSGCGGDEDSPVGETPVPESPAADLTPAPGGSAGTTPDLPSSPVAPSATASAAAELDAAWVATTCSALGRWLGEADDDENSLRGLALAGDTDPAALRRKALAVVDASAARTRDLAALLADAGTPADADLAALAGATGRVVGDTVAVLDRVRPRIAELPVADGDAFARAAGPVVAEVLVEEARLVAELTSAVAQAKASGAGDAFATTVECRSLDEGLRLPPG